MTMSSGFWRVIHEQDVDVEPDGFDLMQKALEIFEVWWQKPNVVNDRCRGATLLGDAEAALVEEKFGVCSSDAESLGSTQSGVAARYLSFFTAGSAIRLDAGHPLNDFHPTCPYEIALRLMSTDTVKLTISVCIGAPEIMSETCWIRWFKKDLIPKIASWITQPSFSLKPCHALVDCEIYAKVHRRLKNTYRKDLFESWTERTDPEKFISEDFSIAAYFLTLLVQRGESPSTASFVDLGCGNGLLAYLLKCEGLNGYGIDSRRRKIWSKFEQKVDLIVNSIDPSTTVFENATWIIGNHSDELTPWIPVIAAKSRANYLVIPCCPFAFYGKFQRHQVNRRSQYAEFLEFVEDVGVSFGFDVSRDGLRIPSTRRVCFIGSYNLNVAYIDVDAVISKYSHKNALFRAKDAPNPGNRNCSQLPRPILDSMVLKIAMTLLEHQNYVQLRGRPWNAGGSMTLPECVALMDDGERQYLHPFVGSMTLPECVALMDDGERQYLHPFVGSMTLPECVALMDDGERQYLHPFVGSMTLPECVALMDDGERQYLRNQFGGIQTLIRNHRHIFSLDKMCVQLNRGWTPKKWPLKRLHPCWFYKNHPDGCPREDCPSLHDDSDQCTDTQSSNIDCTDLRDLSIPMECSDVIANPSMDGAV